MQEVASSLSRFRPEIALTAALLLVVLVDATGVARSATPPAGS